MDRNNGMTVTQTGVARGCRVAAMALLLIAAMGVWGCQEEAVSSPAPQASKHTDTATEPTTASASAATASTPSDAASTSADQPAGNLKTAVFAGGCFWCVEAVFEEIDGVKDVTSGYAGGKAETANYPAVCTGLTGHAESVQITYDPAKVSYEKLLSIHFATHDPTTKNRQGADVGTQYRSAIFYSNDTEKQQAADMIARLNKTDAFKGRPIVTTLEPLTKFYPAEQYHQNYVCQNPFNPYVAHVAMPKVEKVRHLFKDDLKKKESEKMSDEKKAGEPTSKVEHTEEEWKKLLTPEQYYVLREKGTERPFVNKFDEHFEPGTYVCAACGAELFSSDTKFNSGCGWPAFYAAKAGDRVKLHRDTSAFMIRTEVTCARCGGHLGHIFDDAPQTPTGQRYCINSVSLKFIPAKKDGAAATDAKTAE